MKFWPFSKPRRRYPHEVRSPKASPPPKDPSGRVPSPPPPGPSPPDYLGAETCAECWEPFDDVFGALDRWLHRRRWGHNPVRLYIKPTAWERHQRNVIDARRYREGR